MPGGLTVREGITVVETVFDTGRLKVLDLVEVNPEIGSSIDVKKTVDSAIHLFKAACGTQRSGNLPVDSCEIPKP